MPKKDVQKGAATAHPAGVTRHYRLGVMKNIQLSGDLLNLSKYGQDRLRLHIIKFVLLAKIRPERD